MVTFNDFKKLELKTAKVLSAENHPNADKLYIMKIDLGTEQRQIVAGIKMHYKPEELVGKNIIVVSNLQPVALRGVESQAMLLAAQSGSTVTLVVLDKDLPAGSKVS